jgi:hypothetical protein
MKTFLSSCVDRKHLFTSLACSAVFGWIVAACGGVSTTSVTGGTGIFAPTAGVQRAVFVSGPVNSNRMLPGGTRLFSSAALFQTMGGTGVAQSMNAACDLGFDTTTAIGPFVPIVTRGASCNGFFTQPQTGLAATFTNRVIDPGTLTAMTVIIVGSAAHGSRVELFSGAQSTGLGCAPGASDRCDVRNAALAVTDNTPLTAYLILAGGDTITRVEVYISKT